MMIPVPQVEPISSLRRDHVAVMNKLRKGPVFLAQRGALTAALVSIEEWNRAAQRLQELEWREEARRASQEACEGNEPDMSYNEFMSELSAYHARS